MKPTPGKIYYIKTVPRSSGDGTSPAMALWEPEYYDSDPVPENSKLYTSPLLLWNFVKHGFDEEFLAEFIYLGKSYWTDWFSLDNFFDYFEPCIKNHK